jgi:hypothetical protein
MASLYYCLQPGKSKPRFMPKEKSPTIADLCPNISMKSLSGCVRPICIALRVYGLPAPTSLLRPYLREKFQCLKTVNLEDEIHTNIFKLSSHLTGNIMCLYYKHKSDFAV